MKQSLQREIDNLETCISDIQNVPANHFYGWMNVVLAMKNAGKKLRECAETIEEQRKIIMEQKEQISDLLVSIGDKQEIIEIQQEQISDLLGERI